MNLGSFYGSLHNGGQNSTRGHAPGFVERGSTPQFNAEFLAGSEVIANQQDHMATVMVCDEINKEVKNLRMEVATLKKSIEDLRTKKVVECHNERAVHISRKLPTGLSVCNDEELFNEIEPFHSPDCAVHRFYESRRREYNDAKPGRRQQVVKNSLLRRMRGYQKRLYKRRAKVLLNAKERKRWAEINECYMTEESEDEESGNIRQHHLPWESDALKKAKSVLDSRIKSRNLRSGQFGAKPRIESTPSTLPIPHNPVKWAVKRDRPDDVQHISATGDNHNQGTSQEIITTMNRDDLGNNLHHTNPDNRSDNDAFIRHASQPNAITPTISRNSDNQINLVPHRPLFRSPFTENSMHHDDSTPHRGRHLLQPTILGASSTESSSVTERRPTHPTNWQQAQQAFRVTSNRLDAEEVLNAFDHEEEEEEFAEWT